MLQREKQKKSFYILKYGQRASEKRHKIMKKILFIEKKTKKSF